MGTRVVYLEELDKLNRQVIKMGTILETSINMTLKNLTELRDDVAHNIISRDDQIDDLELSIEKECIDLIAKQQPVATDLRKITSILKLITDIERIADHCADISEYVLRLSVQERMDPPKNLFLMAEAMKGMANGVIMSFVNQDGQAARAVADQDDIVDGFFHQLLHELGDIMEENPALIPQCIEYLMITKYLERMADHSANIAKWVGFIVTGELEG
ncbi:MAG: phosphate signaling complex protein PhoU [Lachnospiraceae bacterium]|nr:phosphate signaling complex protein PhoU [Lachnospiraceae bacterium]